MGMLKAMRSTKMLIAQVSCSMVKNIFGRGGGGLEGVR